MGSQHSLSPRRQRRRGRKNETDTTIHEKLYAQEFYPHKKDSLLIDVRPDKVNFAAYLHAFENALEKYGWTMDQYFSSVKVERAAWRRRNSTECSHREASARVLSNWGFSGNGFAELVREAYEATVGPIPRQDGYDTRIGARGFIGGSKLIGGRTRFS